ARLPSANEARWVFAEHGDDAHLIALHNGDNSVPLYRLGLNDSGDFDTEAGANSVFLFTERGVYKPGDVVHLKGIARNLDDNRKKIPAGKKLKITATDARDREFFSKQIALSDFGSFAEEITLPAGTLGRYRVSAAGAEKDHISGICNFQVQEYRPNAFEIFIPPTPAATGPVQLDLAVAAKYLLCKPLVKAKLTSCLSGRADAFKPECPDEFACCTAVADVRLSRGRDRIAQCNAQGAADLDASGMAKVATPLPMNPKAPQPRAAKLLCEVTDLSQQTVSESRAFVQHASDFYLG